MTMQFADRARALVGCRFRPQGRDPREGIDCIGLVAAVFGVPAEAIPRDYSLRGEHLERIREGLARHFRPVGRARAGAGDIALFLVARDQLHLGILTDRGLVHADAGLRRVVETPGDAPWPMIACYRFTDAPARG